jgi:hypothetical protein
MSENTNPILMTQAEYARHRNKSPQYIGKLYKAGILVMRGRLVDVAASDAVLDDKPSEKTTMAASRPRAMPRRGWPTWCSAPNCAAWSSTPARANWSRPLW